MFGKAKAATKIVGDVTDTIDGIGERRQAKRELDDAPLAAQRRLNERDQECGFFRAGWRPALAWVCVLYFTAFIVATGFPMLGMDVARLAEGLPYVMSILGILTGVREFGKLKGTNTTGRLFRFRRGRK